jgi:hypothetical protein
MKARGSWGLGPGWALGLVLTYFAWYCRNYYRIVIHLIMNDM